MQYQADDYLYCTAYGSILQFTELTGDCEDLDASLGETKAQYQGRTSIGGCRIVVVDCQWSIRSGRRASNGY